MKLRNALLATLPSYAEPQTLAPPLALRHSPF